MKTLFRWGLIVVGGAVLVGIIYNIFFHTWPLYPFWGWRVHSFGPRMWPFFPFLGMLILFVAGILIAKYFFQVLRDSSISRKNRLTFCPYCGKEISQMKTIHEVQAEKV